MEDKERADDLLIQEELRGQRYYGWKMLVACILLNRTKAVQVRPVLKNLLDRWPDPRGLGNASVYDVRDVVRPLGLYMERSFNLIRMSNMYRRDVPIAELPGVGEYAMDSWMIFVEGNLTINPKDAKLRVYVERRRHDKEVRGISD